ncbi:MAG TPA: precorrin-6y C5,15-methyltransferase (decarboxylating) subunit CbiE [Propionibacteriaceae bacterium]|nr:precorrin-6y C5,15-methyltransferase (decarboxylating) subunit CbiE [Propionibacteriaceae bacterium]
MIELVGLSARGWHDLPERLRATIRSAEVLLGSPRHFDLLPPFPDQQRLPWPTPLRDGLPGLLNQVTGRRVVALASGDPLIAGIGSTLVEMLGAAAVRVHPAVSSVALARARMGWPEETTQLVRLRGGDLDSVRRYLFPDCHLIILSRDADSPSEVAQLLTDEGYGDSTMTVLGDLDAESESRTDTFARDWSGKAPALNVICLACAGAGRDASLAPGLPDAAFDHDGLLTKRDLRASALARLMPRPGEVLWDIGAGAGSIAIEWIRADPRCHAIAVEHNAERIKRIRRNAEALGVPDLEVVHVEAAAALDSLPRPDAVFVGGGATPETLERSWSALLPGGRLVVHAVTQETEMIIVDCWRRYGGELTRLSVEHLEPIGRYHGWRPARPVVQWSAIKDLQ